MEHKYLEVWCPWCGKRMLPDVTLNEGGAQRSYVCRCGARTPAVIGDQEAAFRKAVAPVRKRGLIHIPELLQMVGKPMVLETIHEGFYLRWTVLVKAYDDPRPGREGKHLFVFSDTRCPWDYSLGPDAFEGKFVFRDEDFGNELKVWHDMPNEDELERDPLWLGYHW